VASSRPLRADAARNRESILAAATLLMAERGLEVALDDVARAARVGNATLYRNFATLQILQETVLDAKVEAYADDVEAAAAAAAVDPWPSFVGFVNSLVGELLANRAFAEVLAAPTRGSERFRAQLQRSYEASIVLCERARGELRPDFHHSDLLLLNRSVNGLLLAGRESASATAPRLVALFLDAVRAGGERGTLPAPPPRWDRSMDPRHGR
jgi:AcrR family transcriptional regulator